MIRRAAVAGLFYDGSGRALRPQVEDLVPRAEEKVKAIGVVVPHAGYLYSGGVAGAVYGRVNPPETCVVLGPNHSGMGAGAAIMTAGTWETPLGEVTVDPELARAIVDRSRVLEEDDRAHRKEHSIEVHLPFLQVLFPGIPFVPICLWSHEYGACRDVGQAVAEAIRGSSRQVLLIASTDMSHYISHDIAEVKDRTAIEAMLELDPERLHATVLRERISMCGFHPTTAMLIAAKALGASRAELIRYATSGDVTKDYSSVVGYAGLIIR
ncbi:MAG: AmmeMemoRadiSam system protein B [Candidatus Methylomirabilales bacterium]